MKIFPYLTKWKVLSLKQQLKVSQSGGLLKPDIQGWGSKFFFLGSGSAEKTNPDPDQTLYRKEEKKIYIF